MKAGEEVHFFQVTRKSNVVIEVDLENFKKKDENDNENKNLEDD